MRIVSREFLNSNEYRSYPIDVDATFEPYTAEDITLVNSLLTDIKITVPKDVAACVYLSNVTVSAALITMTLMGSNTHPFSPNTPSASSLSNAMLPTYTALGAVLIARVQAKRLSSSIGKAIELIPAVNGVGGWVVFGSGALQQGSWSFTGPSSAMVSDRCVTRFDYGGVFNVSKSGFTTNLTGEINLEGRGGIEVVADPALPDTGLIIRFSGYPAEVKESLAAYIGTCGGRPESNNCTRVEGGGGSGSGSGSGSGGGNVSIVTGTPGVRTINGVPPKGPDDEVLIVLGPPFYGGYITPGGGSGNGSGIGISSDVPFDNFKPHVKIPGPGGFGGRGNPSGGPGGVCASGAQASTVNPTAYHAEPPVSIAVGTQLTLDVAPASGARWASFTYVQQLASNPNIAVFTTLSNLSVLGDELNKLHLDVATNEWQAYGAAGPSLLAFGRLTVALSSNKTVEYNGLEHLVTLGKTTTYDQLGITTLAVGVAEVGSFDGIGTYVRAGYAKYIHSQNPLYSLELAGTPDTTWSIIYAGSTIITGSMSPTGDVITIQSFIKPDGSYGSRTISIMGVVDGTS